MVKSFLILTLLKLALCKDLCIPQGNKCLYKWQCCKGFHCENPHYQDEKHCIADHEQLEHKSETVPELSARTSPMMDPESDPAINPQPEPEPVDPVDPDQPEPVDPEAKPSVRETMMSLFEAGLQQLTQGKPIKMKVKVKNPEVLLSKLKPQPEPTPQKGEPNVDPAAFRNQVNKQERRKFKSPWGTHHYKEDSDRGKMTEVEKMAKAFRQVTGCVGPHCNGPSCCPVCYDFCI